MPTIVTKGPNADLDYVFDWTAWLGAGDTITDVQWTVPGELTKTKNATVSGGRATIWLGGGTLGRQYTITCKIVTAQGRTDERDLVVRIARR